MFDRFEVTAAGDKICAQNFMPALEPSLLQRSQYFAYMYLGWSLSAVQKLCLIAQGSTKLWPFAIKNKSLFFGRDIARVRGTLSGNLTSNDLDLVLLSL